ncbi:hypothetical protein Tco_1450396, partial [Tanacetum coccineum]
MAAPIISISSDLSDESVRSSILRVILIGSISVEVLIAPEVGAAEVASPAGVLDTHSSSEDDLSESSLPPVSVAHMVSPFLCSNDSESDTEMPERHVSPTPHDVILTRWRSRVASRSSSPTTSTPEISTAPIPPAPSAIVAPSTDIISHIDIIHLQIIHSSGHSISGHSVSGHTPPVTTIADSPAPSRFVYPPLARTPRSPAATMTSSIHALRALVPFHVDLLPPHKRFRDSISPEDSVEEDIDTDMLVNIEAYATAIRVAADMDVEAGVDAGIGMEVDVGVDVEDGVEGEVESSDRGIIEVGVDVVVGIDIPDGMLILDVAKRLEQVEEVVQDIYGHVMEIPLQRVEDIKTGQRELEARSLIASRERASLLDQVSSLERSNARLRGTLMMESARADRFWQRMGFIESELMQIRRFRYYDRMRFRILETFAASKNGDDNDNGNGEGNGGGNGNGNLNRNDR